MKRERQMRAATPNSPGPNRNEAGESVLTAAIASTAVTTIVVTRERPSSHAGSPVSVGSSSRSAT